MATKYKKNSIKCKLMPHEITPVFSIQEASQKSGWWITKLGFPEVWKSSQGEGVLIGVINSGVDITHPDLIDNLVPGINFVEKGMPPTDVIGHGTHVAGIIDAENNAIGVVGVAPKSKVMPIKVIGSNGEGKFSNVASGIYYAVDHGANIITMSLGSPIHLKEVEQAVRYAYKKNVPIFCASGNSGKVNNIYYPARYKETIAVGAIDENFKRALFSNTGENLDFMAPGVDILSTIPENWYGILSGTSQAAPFIAGIAALALSYVKNNTTNIKLNTVEDIRNLLKNHTIQSKNHLSDGFGIINMINFHKWFD